MCLEEVHCADGSEAGHCFHLVIAARMAKSKNHPTGNGNRVFQYGGAWGGTHPVKKEKLPEKNIFSLDIPSSYAKILGETKFQSQEIPRSG